ncbi:MAG: ABC transporter substrate-binding protein, partial [Acidimicrobiales bacterium]
TWGAAWHPGYFSSSAAKSTLGKWRSAPIPQWSAGQHVDGDWGGSAYPVFKSSKHPQAAETFAAWMMGTMTSWKKLIGQPSVLFPSFLPMLNSTLLSNSTLPLTGNQHYYVPFIKGASNLPTDWQWGPFNVYERTQQDNALAQVANGKMTLVQAMKQVQTKMINYAQSQGLSASS